MIHSLFLQVSVHAKIMKIGQKTDIEIFGTTKTKQSVMIADNTNCLELSLFEEFVGNVEESKSYFFTNLSTRDYNNTITLTTTFTSTIKDAPQLLEVQQPDQAPDDVQLRGTVETVQAVILTKCISCRKSLQESTVGPKFARCASCGMRQKSSALVGTVSLTLLIKSDSKSNRYKCSHDVLSTFLKIIKKEDIIQNKDEIEENLLSFEYLKFSVIDSLVTKISLVEDQEDQDDFLSKIDHDALQ